MGDLMIALAALLAVFGLTVAGVLAVELTSAAPPSPPLPLVHYAFLALTMAVLAFVVAFGVFVGIWAADSLRSPPADQVDVSAFD